MQIASVLEEYIYVARHKQLSEGLCYRSSWVLDRVGQIEAVKESLPCHSGCRQQICFKKFSACLILVVYDMKGCGSLLFLERKLLDFWGYFNESEARSEVLNSLSRVQSFLILSPV